jgi:hypothetical protein
MMIGATAGTPLPSKEAAPNPPDGTSWLRRNRGTRFEGREWCRPPSGLTDIPQDETSQDLVGIPGISEVSMSRRLGPIPGRTEDDLKQKAAKDAKVQESILRVSIYP